ncbi:MAG: HypC/HybG/HupF family hydrogenase formation chaperone [Motiliproteus sp.]|nr:HypC/HybG/HupF family hydrogenase formation chaperone [Motiliproteus sp.]MCW9051757.1 HypC/HybG/HupF family hydrogenase formation chaperone [Motiliproteus sp.]
MCIGIPMQVVEVEGDQALCYHLGEPRRVDISLVGVQPPGTWILVFLNAAREVISELRAIQVKKALLALEAVARGDTADVDELFADIVDQEPQLPPHLQELVE